MQAENRESSVLNNSRKIFTTIKRQKHRHYVFEMKSTLVSVGTVLLLNSQNPELKKKKYLYKIINRSKSQLLLNILWLHLLFDLNSHCFITKSIVYVTLLLIIEFFVWKLLHNTIKKKKKKVMNNFTVEKHSLLFNVGLVLKNIRCKSTS